MKVSRPLGWFRRHAMERLESRIVLAAEAVITEFMASNSSILADEDGDFSDWIEIYNPGPGDIDMDGWYLTDDPGDLWQWAFPSQILTAGNFLIVFSSNKDRSIAGNELHTNFGLTSTGEYLALAHDEVAGGITNTVVASEFSPSFPLQKNDISYGLAQTVTSSQLLPENPTGNNVPRLLLPTDNSLAGSWMLPGFDDSAGSWQDASRSIGYETSVAGMTVTNYKSTTTVGSLSAAQSVLASPGQQASVVTEIRDVINYLGTGGTGHYNGDYPFPGSFIGEDVNDFVVEATGTVTIPVAGQWTFGVNSDDGFGLDVGPFHSEFAAPRGPGDTLATFNFAAAGDYPIRLLMYERGGGAEVEMFAAQGSFSSFTASSFRLVGDVAGGGLSIQTDPQGGGGTSGFSGLIETNVETVMRNRHSTAYLRIPFDVSDPGTLNSLNLRTRYDDGFVAYLNGVEIARRNVVAGPGTISFDDVSLTDRSESLSVLVENIDISAHVGMLSVGKNVLAIHALNDSLDSNEFLFSAELTDISVQGGDLRFFSLPSPGDFNSSTSFVDFVAPVELSVPHGFIDAPFSLSMSVATPGAQIRFTTNGTAPTSSTGSVYSGPVAIGGTTIVRAAAFKTDFVPTNATTATYILLNDVITQSPNGQAPAPGWPTGSVNGQIIDYGLDPDIVGNPTYSGTIKDDLQSITSVSIVMDLGDLFDSSRGIYVNAGGEGRQWERPASIEWIEPNGDSGFQVDAGIRIRGGFSRSDSNPKHAFRLFFRQEYGDSKLKYPVFGDEGAGEFDNLDLRTSQNYSWSFQGDSRNTMNRDVFSRDAQRALGQPYTRSRYYHLYINGQYWGVYQSQERSEAAFGATYFGGAKEDYDVVKAEAGPYTTVATDGNMEAWRRFWEASNEIAAESNSTTRYALYQKLQGLNADGSRNPAYEVLLDSENLIVYMLAIVYGGNLDAPISNFLGNTRVNNWFGMRDRTGEEGWRFFAHDSEHTLLNVNQDRTGPYTAGDQFQYSNPQWIWQQLWTVDAFRLQTADIVQKSFFDGGPFSPEGAESLFLARKAELDRAIVGESARWGDSKRSTPYTRNTWLSAINNIVNNFIPGRTGVVLNQLRSKGLYPNVETPTFSNPGGAVDPGFAIDITAPSGVVYYTTDGTDPRGVDGNPGATALAVNSTEAFVTSTDSSKSALKWTVPSGNISNWQSVGFDDSSWNSQAGADHLPIGFDTGQSENSPGLTFRVVDTNSGQISNVGVATNILEDNTTGFAIASDTTQTVDYVNHGDGGNLSSPSVLPMPGTSDRTDYAVRASAEVTIPAGTWTVAVGSDDGFRLTINGVNFTNEVNTNFDNIGTPEPDQLVYSRPRGHQQTLGRFTLGTPLTTTLQLDFYERGGGDSLELSIASGGFGSFSTSNFRILRDGQFGWNVNTDTPTIPFAPLIETDIRSAMFQQNATAYARIPFTANNIAAIETLTLRMRYDDGYVAYLNGTQIASRNAPGSLSFNTSATDVRGDSQAVAFESLDISAFKSLLNEGSANVLAIHGLNAASGNTDFLLDVQLDGVYSGASIVISESGPIKARALDGGEWSALEEATFLTNTPASIANLTVSEIHYNPPGSGDPTEFLELVNTSGDLVDLTGATIESGPRIPFTFSGPDLALQPGDRVVVVKDQLAFELLYGTSVRIVGEYEGSLNNAGEQLRIVDRFGGVIFDFIYQDGGLGWPGRGDGNGSSLELVSPLAVPTTTTERTAYLQDGGNWRNSNEYGGSPGVPGTGPIVNIVVNEVLAHTDLPLLDTIELYNATASAIDVGGWYLSDSNADYKKYKIPSGTIIGPFDYLLIDESEFNPDPLNPAPNHFALSSAGDDVWLMAADIQENLTRFVDRVEFPGSPNGESFGRWPNGVGELTPMTSRTLGEVNSGPRFGPLLISEVMYHPIDPDGPGGPVLADDLEFVEIFNPTGNTVDLFNWQISGVGPFTFGAGVQLPPNQTVVLVAFDPANNTLLTNFKTHYGVGDNGLFAGPYTGQLDNGGERVRLLHPDDNTLDPPRYIEDEVIYDDIVPWPTSADGLGNSLRRLSGQHWGNDPASWTGEIPSPGDASNLIDGNIPPIASVGGPYTILVGEDMLLDGTGSNDPDEAAGDQIVRYEWDLNNDGLFDDAVGAAPVVPWSQLILLAWPADPTTSLPTNTIRLRVTDSFDAVSVATTTLTIFNDQPVAAISATPNPAAPDQQITLDGSSSAHGNPGRSIVEYAWDFNYDGVNFGTDSIGLTVSHSFATFGQHKVALRVTDDAAPAKTDIVTIQIDVSLGNLSPVAEVGGPYAIDAGDDLQLDATASTDPNELAGDSIVSYDWDLDNDGAFDDATGESPLIPWSLLEPLAWPADPISGLPSNPIRLRLTDSFGDTSVGSTTLIIYANMPVAEFATNKTSLSPLEELMLDASDSRHLHPNHSIVEYQWDFDYDGGTFDVDLQGIVVTHAFDTFGSRTVALRVVDDNTPALSDITTIQINIDQGNVPPIAEPGGPYVIIEGANLALDGSASQDPNESAGDSIVSYEWDLDDDGAFDDATGINPTVPWSQLEALGIGTSPIHLRVTDSFGLTNSSAGNPSVLIDVGSPVTALVPSMNIGDSWRTDLVFNSTGWLTGTTGVGYERGSGYESLFGLDLDNPPDNQTAMPMRNVNETAYLRIPFEIVGIPQFDSLTLRMKFDDGFVAYLNGVEVASSHAPGRDGNGGALTWDSGATTLNQDGDAVVFEDFDISSFSGALTSGTNLLAFHGLNRQLNSSDFVILPELVGVDRRSTTSLIIEEGAPTAAFSVAPNPVDANQPITLDAGSSFHDSPIHEIVIYEWDLDYDGSTFIADRNGLSIQPVYATAGIRTIALRVTDDNTPAKMDITTLTIEVSLGNRPPLANPGGPYMIEVGTELTLDGSNSTDPDMDAGDSIVSYQWDLDDDGQFDDASGATPLVPWSLLQTLPYPADPNSQLPNNPIRLRVTDSFGLSNVVETTLAIFENRPVAQFSATPNPAAVGQPVSLDASGSHHLSPSRSIVVYQWDFDYDGNSFDVDATGTTAAPSYDLFGDYAIALRVTDDNPPAKMDITTLTIEVSLGNRPPLANPGGPYMIEVDTELTLDGSNSTDPDMDAGDSIVSYQWDLDDDGQFDDASGAIVADFVDPSWVPGETRSIRLRVTDSFGVSTVATTTLDVAELIAPTADASGPYTFDEGTSFTLDGNGSSDDRAIAIYEWDLDYDGVTFDVDRTGSQPMLGPLDDFVVRTIALRVTDTDGLRNIATTTLSVNNLDPTINSQPPLTTQSGKLYTYAPIATDPANTDGTLRDPFTWSLVTAPQDMQIDSNSGEIQWSPTSGGIETIILRVFDGDSGVADQTWTIDVELPVLIGDLNGDSIIDEADFREFVRHFGNRNATTEQGDLNGDSRVGIADLSLLQQNMTPPAGSPPASSPMAEILPPVVTLDEESNVARTDFVFEQSDDRNSLAHDTNDARLSRLQRARDNTERRMSKAARFRTSAEDDTPHRSLSGPILRLRSRRHLMVDADSDEELPDDR